MSRKAAAAERQAARQAKQGLWNPKGREHAGGSPRHGATSNVATGLASVTVSPDLNCDVTTTVDSAPSFYGGNACGTFFEVDGSIYGPASVPAGLSAGGLTSVSQTTTGSGTTGDPYVITTVVDVGSTGITATETDTWAAGATSYSTSVQLNNTDSASHSFHVYRAGDCYFDSNDVGFGEIAGLAGLPAGAVACRSAWNQSVPGNRMMEWVPQTAGVTSVEDNYGTVWQDVGAGGNLPGTCQCTSYIDNGMAIGWAGNLAAGAVQSYNSSLVFNDNVPGSTPSPGEQGGGPNESENRTTCSAGDPVNCATGDFFHQFTDVALPGRGVILSLQRSYSSAAAAADSPFGHGWTDSYNMSLATDSAGDVTVNQEDGSTITFSPDGNGGFAAPPRVFATLVKNSDGSFTLNRQRTQVQYNFSAAGQLTSEVDRNGYVTNLAYTNGNLTKVTDPAGRTLTFTYSGPHIASVTGPLGRTYSYSYDSSGNLTRATDPAGRAYAFTYDASHRLLTMTDPRGGTVTNNYDSLGRVVSQTDADGNTTTWAYSGDPTSSSGGTTTLTDPLGNKTVYSYLNLELMAVTHGASTASAATTSYTYDPATLGLATVTDPNGNVTVNTYDGSGNLLTATDPLSNTTSYTYNNSDEVLSKTSPLGETTSYSYDGNGNMQSVTDPLSNTTSYAYSDSAHPGDVTSVTNPDGNVTSYTYDGNGDVASMSVSPSSGVTNTTTYAYDADGERTCAASPNATAAGVVCPAAGSPKVADTTASSYNADGEITSVTNPLGRTTGYGYDGNGNRIQVTDPAAHVTGYTYNGNNQQTKVTRPDGTSLSSTYDANGNLTSQVNAAGATTKYTYDPLNRVTSTTDPLGHTTRYWYDLDGNRTTLTDPSGRVTTYSYDSASQLTGITYSDGATPNVSYSYDADGQRSSMTDGTGTTSYSFDGDGHLTSLTNGASATVSYGYDPAGHLTSLTYPNGTTVTRTYDGAGRLASVTDWLGNQTKFGYDRDGNLTSETYPNGVTATATFDNADQQVSITDRKGATSLASFSYARDNLSQVTSDTETGAMAGKNTYSYNQVSQLTSDNAKPYGYDTAGNPVTLASGTTQSFNTGSEVTAAQRPATSVAPATDQVVSANRTSHGTTLTAPAFATTTSGELVVAFISAAGPSTGKQQVTAVKGGGLQWTLVTRQNTQQGDAEIWQAHAAGPLTAATVTATLAASADGSITVASFTHARSVTGAHAIASGDSTNPAVVVKTTAADSLVWGTGEDATSAKQPTPASGQSLVHEYSDTASHATYWAQKTGAITAAGTSLRLSDTTNKDHWNLAAVEITSDAGTKNSYSYDSQGNRISIVPSSGPSTTLKYDQANRLTAYGTIASYAYNGDGLRMSKTVSGATVSFGWDQSGSLPLVIASGSTSYLYGPGNQPIEQVTGTTVTYLQDDQQGSTRLLTSSTGAIVGTYSYSPYGTPARHTGTVPTPLQFDGQYTDYESGLQYLQARYYDRITAQFISMDPAVSFTAQPYSYAADNPLNTADPTGEFTITDCYSAGGTLFHITHSWGLCFNFGRNGYTVATTQSTGFDTGRFGASAANTYGVSQGEPSPSPCSCSIDVGGSRYAGVGGTASVSRSCDGTLAASGGLGIGLGASATATVTQGNTILSESWAQWRRDWHDTIFHPTTIWRGLGL
jgi:RHS repeat-associated protein